IGFENTFSKQLYFQIGVGYFSRQRPLEVRFLRSRSHRRNGIAGALTAQGNVSLTDSLVQ
ncbi:MAG: hypothetical protein WC088_05695, partial [Candidatus Izemoplasmatales bacterium]